MNETKLLDEIAKDMANAERLLQEWRAEVVSHRGLTI
jgi:hypothetical protein